VHNFARECQSIRCKNFLPHFQFVATILCRSLGHKINTFRAIVALHLFVSMTLTETSIDKMNKTHQKFRGSKCSPFTQPHVLKRLDCCAVAATIMLWSTHSAVSRCSFNSFTSWILEWNDTSLAVVLDSNLANWMATSLGGELWCFFLYQCDSVTCTVQFH